MFTILFDVFREIEFAVDDIHAAIGELDPYSASLDNDIPEKAHSLSSFYAEVEQVTGLLKMVLFTKN